MGNYNMSNKEVSYSDQFLLPEEIVRTIFDYLDLNTIYFTLKQVCKQMNAYVNNYVSLEGIFLVTSSNTTHDELLYILENIPKKLRHIGNVFYQFLTCITIIKELT